MVEEKGAVVTSGATIEECAAEENGAVVENGAVRDAVDGWGAANDDDGREGRRFCIENVVVVAAVDGAVARERGMEGDAIIGAGKGCRGAGRNEDVFGSRWVVILGGGTAL